MPVTSTATTVGTARTVISANSQDTKLVYVQDGDYDNETAVYVGGSAVTAANGIKLSKTNTTVFQLNADDSLFAIGSDATSAVRVTEVK